MTNAVVPEHIVDVAVSYMRLVLVEEVDAVPYVLAALLLIGGYLGIFLIEQAGVVVVEADIFQHGVAGVINGTVGVD